VAGASIEVKIEDQEVKALIQRIQRRLSDLTPAMKIIGSIVRTSVMRNFEVGGRPRWKPLSPITLARRKGNKILMRQGFAGGLAGSIHYKAEKDKAIVGTNKIYAAVHQFGARKGSIGEFTV
jgi:phage virion morphogenesis protein